MDSMNSSSVNTGGNSFNSEQIRSSSYSCNTSVISSNDEESKAFNGMDTNTCKEHDPVKELATSDDLSEELSDSMLIESHSDSKKANELSSLETDFAASSNVDDTKQCWLNKPLETDPIASNVDTKQHQLSRSFDSIAVPSCNVDGSNSQMIEVNQTVDVSKQMQQMLKINVRSDTELDSDDLIFSQESLNDDKNKEDKLDNLDCIICMFKMCESMNDDMNVIEIAPPVFNDCDVESDDDEWDFYAGPDRSFFDILRTPGCA